MSMFDRLLYAIPLIAFVSAALFGFGILEGMTRGDAYICATIIWAVYMSKEH